MTEEERNLLLQTARVTSEIAKYYFNGAHYAGDWELDQAIEALEQHEHRVTPSAILPDGTVANEGVTSRDVSEWCRIIPWGSDEEHCNTCGVTWDKRDFPPCPNKD